MIGSTTFSTVFGAAPAGDAEAFTTITKAAIRAGYSPVLLQPGGKEPGCVLSTRAATAADKARMDALAAGGAQRITNVRHECGFKHVLDDPAKVGPIIARFGERYGTPLNLGLHLGRSRLIAVDVDTPDERAAFSRWWDEHNYTQMHPGLTQESPGSFDQATQTWKHWGGGHWVFTVPDDWAMPAGKVVKGPGGFAVMYGESYILVPPSVRPEGPYRLTGSAGPAPAALLDFITTGAAAADHDRAAFVLNQDDPIEQWSAYWPWSVLLERQGWTAAGTHSTCGCPEWTAPGDHASPKSATAHEPGCTGGYDTSTGWGPLKIWTDHPPDGLPPGGAVTKLQYSAIVWHGGDVHETMKASELFIETEIPKLKAFDRDFTSGFAHPGPAEPFLATDPVAPPVRALEWTPASDITMRATRWLWEVEGARWMALGGLTLLAGREGVGKSTWAYQLAAQVSLGQLPGAFFGQPRSVVIAATEDAWEETIKPRLAAAGADMSKVFRVRVAETRAGLTLPTDVPGLKQGCLDRGVALILLDPLMGTISGKLDSHKDAEVRQALEPITKLADDLKISIIGLMHQNKSGKGDLLQKLMASVAFSAVARGVLVCSRDLDAVDPDSGEPAADQYIIGQAKNNLGPKVGYSIRYRIEGAKVGWDSELNEPITSSRIVEMGMADVGVDELVERQEHPGREAPALGAAQDWLKGHLDLKGDVPSGDVKAKALEAGFKPDTLVKAAKALGVIKADPSDARKTVWGITIV